MSLRRFAIHTAYCLTMLLTLGSCTFDYFEDDMNYKVFVPEFKERTIRNCRVLVWDKKTGRLVGDRYARVGATNDNVLDAGIFAFRIPPANYKTCVLTDTDSVGFNDIADLTTASFSLDNDGDRRYKEPAYMKFDYINRELVAQGMIVTDTARLELYPAIIKVRYRGTDVSAETVKKAAMTLSNTATRQQISLDTITSGPTDSYTLYNYNDVEPWPQAAEGAKFEFSGLLIPTKENELMHLALNMCDDEGHSIRSYRFALTDRESKPITILHGRVFIIDIYNEGFMITIEGWDESILGGSVEIDGGKNKH